MIGRLPKNELESDKKKIEIFARNEEKSKLTRLDKID